MFRARLLAIREIHNTLKTASNLTDRFVIPL